MTCARHEAGAQPPAPSAPAESPRKPERRSGRTPARLSRLLPALALLLGAFGLLAAAPAQAQDVWSAKLNPVTDGFSNLGCVGVEDGTACSDSDVLEGDDGDDFVHNTVTYTIKRITDQANGDLRVHFAGTGVTKAAFSGLNFCVGTTAFAFSSASVSDHPGAVESRFVWSSASLSWASGTPVNLKIATSCATSTTPTAVPGPPVGLAVTPGATKLDLAWTAPSGTVSSYDVHYTSSTTVAADAAVQTGTAAAGWVDASHTGTTATHSITGLTNTTPYRVRVRGVNSVGNGAWAWGTGTPKATTSGSTDASLSELVVKDFSATLTLDPSFSATKYAYAVPNVDANNRVTVTPTVNQQNATVKVNGTTVASGEASGRVDLSFGANRIMVEVTAQAGNTRNYTVAVTRELPEVHWQHSTASRTEGQTYQHRLEPESNDMVGTVSYAAGATNPASLTDDLGSGRSTGFTMSAGDSYPSTIEVPLADDALNEEDETFTITIEEGTGYTVGSPATVTVTIEDNDPPAAPGSLAVTAGDGALTATWTKPDGPVTGYQLRWKETAATNQDATTAGDPSTGWVEGDEVSSPTLTASAGSLTNGTGYDVQVRATDGTSAGADSDGYGPWSATQAGTPTAPTSTPPMFRPADGATVGEPGTDITLTFAKAIRADASNTLFTNTSIDAILTLRKGSSSGDDIGFNATIRGFGKVVAIDPSSDLEDGDVYVAVSGDWYDVDGNRGAAASATFTVDSTLPDAPTGLKLASGDGALTASWTAPTGTPTGYDVHYTYSLTVAGDAAGQSGNDPSSAWVAVDRGTEASPPTASQAITGLDNGRIYRVRVRTKSADANSAWVHRAGVPQDPAPAAPVFDPADGETVTDAGTDITLTFAEAIKSNASNTDFTGSTIDNILTLKVGSSTGTAIAFDATIDSAKKVVTINPSSNLGNGAVYVAVSNNWYDADGNRGAAASAVFTVADPPPGAVTGLTAHAAPETVILTWTAPSGTVTGYDVHLTRSATVDGNAALGTNRATHWVDASHTGTDATQRIVGLSGQEFRFRVRAKNNNGAGAWAFVRARALEPRAPTHLVVGPGNAKLDLFWRAPSGTVTGYDVHYTSALSTGDTPVGDDDDASGNNPATAWVAVSRTSTDTTASQSIASLTNGTAYRVRVRAKNAGGAGLWAHGTGTPAAAAPPGRPTNLTARPVAQGVTLTWTAPSGTPTGYDVHYTSSVSGADHDADAGSDATTGWVDLEHTGTTASQAVTGLATNAEYRFRVRAKNNNGAGPWAFVRAVAGLPPPAVTGLTVTPGDATLDVSWTAPTGVVPAGYDVHYTSAAAGSVPNDAEAGSNTNPATGWVAVDRGTEADPPAVAQSITGLTNDTLYRVRVRAVERAGGGPWVRETGTPAKPTMGFTGYTEVGLEGESETTKVKLNAALAVDTIVNIEVVTDRPASGRAVEGADFTLSATTLSFAAGETEKTLTVSFVADETTEGDESFFLRLAAPSGTAPYQVREIYSESLYTEVDFSVLDESQDPGLRILADNVTEGDSPVENVVISLGSPAPSGGTAVTLSLGTGTATEGTDFTLSAKTATIAEGESGALVTLTALADEADDDGETVVLNASSTNPAFTAETVTVFVVDTDPPAALTPQNVQATPGNGALTVTWEVPAAVTASDSDFRVNVGRQETGSGVDWPGNPDNFRVPVDQRDPGSMTLTGLSPVAYDVGVWFSYAGEADPVATPGVKTQLLSPVSVVTSTPLPGDPTGLSVTPGNAKLDLSWTAPSGTVTGYDVHYTSASDSGQNAVGDDADVGSNTNAATGWVAVDRGTEVDPPAASQSITGLTNDTPYRVRVRTKNAHGDGAWVRETGTPTATPLPAKLTGMTVLPGLTAIEMTWTAPTGPVTGYDVHYTSAPKAGSGAVGDEDAASGNDASAAWVAVSRTESDPPTAYQSITGLTTGTEYRFRLRAKNAAGAGPWAFVTDTPQALVKPADLTVTPGDGKLDLSWTRQHSQFTYEVHYTSAPKEGSGAVGDEDAAGGDPATAWVLQSNTQIWSRTITGLTNGVEYRVRVRADRISGQGPWAFGTGTPTAQVSNVPTGLTVSAGDGALTASWTAPSGVDVARYEAQVKLTSDTDWPAGDTDVTGTSHTFTGLTNDSPYQVRVRTVETGESVAGDWTAPVEGTPTAAPSSDAALSGLTAGGSTSAGGTYSAFALTPSTFSASVTSYTATVASGITHVKLTATANHAAATLAWRKGASGAFTPVTSGRASAAIALDVGANALTVRVTAEDTTTVQDYTVTVTRQAAGLPLTASFEGVPDEHDGETAFSILLRLSEPASSLSQPPRAASFRVRQGRLQRVERAGAYLWRVWLKPITENDVQVTLEGGRGCAETGAVCTRDGRALQNTVKAVVSEQLRIFTWSAVSMEGRDPHIQMLVELSRTGGVEETVTVDWETADGTATRPEIVEPGRRVRMPSTTPATAGADYTASSGTLTFAPGEWNKFVKVPVLDDAVDERVEYFLIRFSNPQGAGAVLARDQEEQVALITNDDHLQAMWLARFGRTVGSQVTAAVSERLEAGLAPGAHATLAGQPLALSQADDGEALAQTLTGLARAFGAPDAPANEDPGSGAPGSGPGQAGAGAFARHGLADPWNDAATATAARSVTGRELLLGSSFHVAGTGEGSGPALAAWGRVALAGFDGEHADDTGRTGVEGEVMTGVLGADADFGRLLAGVAISLSEGEGSFDSPGADVGKSGDIESTMTTVSPYARFRLSERVTAWGLAGWGTGDMTIRFDDGSMAPVRTDLSMQLGALGARGALLEQDEAGGMDLALKGDAFFVRTESEKAVNSAETQADASRVRLVLEGGRAFAVSETATFRPSLELGVRHDGGDAETGTGVELGGGVAFTDADSGLSIEARARMLLAHADSDYEEWGASATARLDPGERGRGLSFSLSPTIGAPGSASERLWGAHDARALAPDGAAFEASRGLQGEMGYGMGLLGDRFTGTPNLGFGMSDGGARDWRIGWRLTSVVRGDPGFEISLDATRNEPANDNGPVEHGVMLRSLIRW